MGGRRFLINLGGQHSSSDRVNLEFPYGSQPDEGTTLEFYAVVGVVAKAAENIAVAVLGDMALSNVLTGV